MVWSYPSAGHMRRHGPLGYRDYTSFKPWLRDEFAFRCVFCLLRERWFPPFGPDVFSVDHLHSRKQVPERACEYANLVYACVFCNACKKEGLLPDPCAAGYASHLHVEADGMATALTTDGTRLIQVLRLNRAPLVRFRCELLDLLTLAVAHPESETAARVRDLLSFPDGLPDLAALRPPGGNTKPEGVAESSFAQRQRGELPATY